MVIVIPHVVKPTGEPGKDKSLWGKPVADFMVLTSIDYALARIGGPVVEYNGLSSVAGHERICVCGHGSPGHVEGVSAGDLATLLATGKSSLRELLLTCCYAGLRNNDVPGTSVIEILAKGLENTGFWICGALGPSIKAACLGKVFHVVDAPYKSGDPKLKEAGKIQGEAIAATTNPKLGDSTTGAKRDMDFSKIMSKAGSKTDPQRYLADKAAKYANISQTFYQDFLDRLAKSPSNLLKGSNNNQPSMAAALWSGKKVIYRYQ